MPLDLTRGLTILLCWPIEVLFEIEEGLCPECPVLIGSKDLILPDNLDACIIETFRLLPLNPAVFSLDPYLWGI